ncbi:MAG: cob(I)yrinic acid a,c-diamide adenosyltransferase [Candidatus Dadabacteria bacterium]|nr:MAG: cob(I)yrinic acid a,c-diamide adenosyltransferase [Candidatus Dadabacteria bacterium]
MVRINKVYTRTGDKGMTRLGGGQQVPKTAPRIEAYGTVDELNATLGLVAEALRDADPGDLRPRILRIQNELFDLGSQLAVLPEDRVPQMAVISEDDIDRLEQEIDVMNADLPRLESFILPGGGEVSARLHLARTVCRRAERATLRLAEQEPLDGSEIRYLNRLSDWLFVAGRHAATAEGIEETLWRPGAR